ncbi:GNAT family N-acetyltransferase [Halalkalibacter krulwichiae]|uniref:Ribosomal-protein-alanine N-acetyltransferase n=1 Tax=Halalkalibacter krulwichiae TaxID=199441 RepID=A0A1X9MHE7_9BACI|nr:GNAT family N-acetyltransferase [Halalkalibacter krulwichiae]ARK32846.1 ribosomal-protein-alanine N-acetyltransferase [Halalkalibacter krulwichiae]
MFIRKASQVELSFIHSWAPFVQNEATVGYMDGSNMNMNAEMLTFYNGEYHVIGDKQTIFGWVLVGENVLPHEQELSGIILELFVLPKFRQFGYGKHLMTYALNYFKMKNFKKVQLNVFAGNHAKQLYEKLGFYEVSTLMERSI